MLKVLCRSVPFRGSSNVSACCFNREVVLNSLLFRTIATTQSGGKTEKQQLARQPVPDLQDTLTKYVRTVQPYLTQEELKVTESLINEFKTGDVAKKLQAYLVERASKYENWLSDWWLKAAYLEFRQPVVVWSSPGLVFPLQTFDSSADQLTYAANMVKAALSYKERIYKNELPQEKIGSDLLDMAQYKKIFGTCRIPRSKRDELKYNSSSRHIVVAHNNNFFKLNVYYDNDDTLSVEDLYDNLLGIVESSLDREAPIGILSSDNRDNWADSYQLLVEDEQNRTSVSEIESSLFLLCLDSVCDLTKANKQTKAALQTVHGGGSSCNGGNRWFDKTIQFIVNREGEVGLTYEHSPAEGQPIAGMMDYIVDYMSEKYEVIDIECIRNFSQKHQRLPFIINDKLETRITQAEENLNKLIEDLEMDCFTFEDYGKEFIKNKKLSPDSFIQMAQQYAFYKLHKEPGAHYESASTRRFLHGRTETIRSCSVESVQFARQMLNKSASKADKIAALRNAISVHKNYTVEAMNGLGVDRHLLGLRLAAAELGVELPSLFADPGFVRSSHMRISTSQVASRCDGFMCYGPLVQDGYGCCYNPRVNDVNFAVSAFRSVGSTSAPAFSDSLRTSLRDMHNLFAE